MKPKDILMLLTLAAMWGASFLFIRVGANDLGPLVLVFLRVSLAAVTLLLYVIVRRQRPDVLRKWKQYLWLALLNAVIPFSLISTAELRLSASLAAILNATTPLFTAVVAWLWMKDPLTIRKVVGLILGIVGVSILVGWDPHHSGHQLILFASFSLLAAISYAFAGVYSSRVVRGAKPLDIALGQQVWASLVMAPLAGITMRPVHLSPALLVSVLGLAVLCTAVGYLLYFALIQNVGPVRAISVTFLVPVFGLAWGALFLGETISANMVLGLATILLSVGLVVQGSRR